MKGTKEGKKAGKLMKRADKSSRELLQRAVESSQELLKRADVSHVCAPIRYVSQLSPVRTFRSSCRDTAPAADNDSAIVFECTEHDRAAHSTIQQLRTNECTNARMHERTNAQTHTRCKHAIVDARLRVAWFPLPPVRTFRRSVLT